MLRRAGQGKSWDVSIRVVRQTAVRNRWPGQVEPDRKTDHVLDLAGWIYGSALVKTGVRCYVPKENKADAADNVDNGG